MDLAYRIPKSFYFVSLLIGALIVLLLAKEMMGADELLSKYLRYNKKNRLPITARKKNASHGICRRKSKANITRKIRKRMNKMYDWLTRSKSQLHLLSFFSFARAHPHPHSRSLSLTHALIVKFPTMRR